MRLNCPNCGSPIDTPQINMEQMAALCGKCGEVEYFATLLPSRKLKARKVKQPDHYKVYEDDKYLLIRAPMFHIVWRVVFFLFSLGCGVAQSLQAKL